MAKEEEICQCSDLPVLGKRIFVFRLLLLLLLLLALISYSFNPKKVPKE